MFLVVFVELDNSVRKALMLTAILLVLFKFFALPALLIDDLRRGLVLLIRWVRKKFHPPAEEELEKAEKKISRSEFLSKRSEEHTSELQSLMRISYAVFCLKK